MTKTEQDEKTTEWLSWGMHNGVDPDLLVVAALAIGAAQEKATYPEGKARAKADGPVIFATGNRPEDGASQTAKGLVHSMPWDAVVMLDEWVGPDTREQSIQAAKLLHPLLETKKPRKNNKKR
jgi:hypothetical protein